LPPQPADRHAEAGDLLALPTVSPSSRIGVNF
jgi:hypothetical protein